MPVRPLPPNPRPDVALRPEVLAPCGDHDSLRAALVAGADAVYLGLDDGFNARARATHFSLASLGGVVGQAHRAAARVYVTLNTVLFESEIPAAERLVRAVAESGADALIVQDPAVALLARAICPDLEVHASTQMTVSSPEAARFAETLGVTRVVLPRELSVSEIAAYRRGTDLDLEVFVHGAMCVSWSGQCLSSEAWGGRSANRGQCAQACRLPYDLIVDGEYEPLGDLRYLLSPKDLAGYRAIPALLEIGVHTLKIEGRLKGPAYVTTAVRGVRHWIDAVADGRAEDADALADLARDVAEMSIAYSRGFGDGFLAGSDHQTLVEGRFPKHRGAYLGRVRSVEGARVFVASEARTDPYAEGDLASPLPRLGGSTVAASGPHVAGVEPRPGLGVVFDQGEPEFDDEPGGPVFGVEATDDGWTLEFGRPGPDLRRVRVGDRVWVSGDPKLAQQARADMSAPEPTGRWPVKMTVRGLPNVPLGVEVTAGPHRAYAESDALLEPARGGGLDDALLSDKLGSLGGTPFRLSELDATRLRSGLHLPVSALKRLRRELVATLTERVSRGPKRETAAPGVAEALWSGFGTGDLSPGAAHVVPLCRTDAQLDAVIAAGWPEVELDRMELVGLGNAVARARAAGLRVTVATVRVQKPGEEGFDRRIAKLEPEGVLVRHWGGLTHFVEHPEERRPVLHGDFSLNVTNSLTAHHLLGLGLETVTAAHDLDEGQLFTLVESVPPSRLAVTVHHHVPTFHTEHCVYAHTLSSGRDNRSCGRPCDEHRVALRDRVGNEHPVIVDVGCRNTVFNAQAQSAATLVPRLIAAGVWKLRVEFVWETGDEARRVLEGYGALVRGEISPARLLDEIRVHEQFGVTAGTMRVMR